MKKFFKGLGKKSLSKHGSRESVGSLKHTDSNTVAGYDIRDKDLNKLHKASWNGDIGKVRQLSRKDPSPLDKDNRTPLHLACVKGHIDIVQELLEWKAKTNVGDNQAKTPLMKAVECHQTSCVQLLLDYNTEVNARDPNSETVLHYAVKDNQLEIVAILLQSGADANVQNKEGYAPLHLAVLQGLDEIADALLRDAANIDLHDSHQKTPLILAAQEGNISMTKILLRHNADIFLTESRGWTASDVAVMNGHQDCQIILNDYRLRLKRQVSEDDAVPSADSGDSQRGATGKDEQFGVPAANVDGDDSGDETISKASGGAGAGNDSWGDDTDISLATDDKPYKAAPKISLAKFVPLLSEEENDDQHEGDDFDSPELSGGYAEEGWSNGLPPLSAQEASKIMGEPKLSIQRDSLITMKSLDEDDSPRTIRRKVSFKRDEELSEIHNISALDEDASDKGSTTGIAQLISDGPPKSVSPDPPVARMSQEKMKGLSKRSALMEELGISDVEDISEADISENIPPKTDDLCHDDSDWDSTGASEVVPAKPGILKNWKQTSNERDDAQIEAALQSSANGHPIKSSFYQMREETNFEPPTKLKQAKPLAECDWDSNAADDKIASEKEVSEWDSDISDMLSPRDRGKLVRQWSRDKCIFPDATPETTMPGPFLPKIHPHLAHVGIDQSLNALTTNFQKTIQSLSIIGFLVIFVFIPLSHSEEEIAGLLDSLSERRNMLPLSQELELSDNSHRCGDNAQYTDEEESDWDSIAEDLTPREHIPPTGEITYTKLVSDLGLPASIPELPEDEAIYENTKSANTSFVEKDEALVLDVMSSGLVVDKLETTDELEETSLKLSLHEDYDVDLTKRKHVSEANQSTASPMIPPDDDADKWDESDEDELSAHEDNMFGFVPDAGAPPLPMSPPPDYLSPRDGGVDDEVDSGDEEEEESISEWEIERNKIKVANLEHHDKFLEIINSSVHEEKVEPVQRHDQQQMVHFNEDVLDATDSMGFQQKAFTQQFQVTSNLAPEGESRLTEDVDEQDELKDNFDININSLTNVTPEKADQPGTTGQITLSTTGQAAAAKAEEEPVSKGHKIIATKLKMSLHSDGNSYDDEEDSMMSGFDSPRNQRGELGASASNGYIASLLGTSAGVGLYSGAPVDDDGLSYTSTEDLTGDLSSTRITQQNILGRDMIQSMNIRDSSAMLKVQEHMRDQKRQVEREKAQKTLLENKHRVLSKEKTEIQRKLEELTIAKSGLEQSKLDLEARIRALEYNLSEEVEKKKNAELLLKKTKEQLDRKEQQYTSEIEGKQRAELTMRNIQMELRSSQNTIKQLEDEKVELDRQLLHERSARQLQEHINEEQQKLQHQLQQETEMSVATQDLDEAEVFQKLEMSDEGRKAAQSSSEKLSAEVYALKMELDRQRSRFKDDHAMATSENEELLNKIDDLKNEIKLNEDALAHATMKFNVELSSMRTENSMVSSSLEKERATKEKFETELESLRSRLQTTSVELEKAQSARTEIERNIQRDRDEWTKQHERHDLELTSLKDSNQNMQERLHSTDTKLASAENELHVANSSMLEKNNSLAQLQREIEHRRGQQDTLNENYRKEKDHSTKLQVKLESFQDRLSGAQHENLSLKQQLDTAQQALRDQHGAGSDANDKFNLMLSTIRADQDKGHSALEDKNASLNEMVARLKEELRNSDNRRSTLEQDLRRLNTDHNDIIKKLSMAEASLEIAQKFKEQLEVERNQMKLDKERLEARYQAAHEKSVESQVRVSDLTERLQKAEQETVYGKQELATTASNAQTIAKSMPLYSSGGRGKDEMTESVHRLEVDNARMGAELGHEKEKVEMLQRDLDDSQKVRNSLEALCSNLKSANAHIGEKLQGEETTRSLLLQETEDTKDLWEREVLSRSKLGLKIAQLERQKQDLQAQLDEERRKVRKVVDAKRLVESRLDAEMQKNNQLQKEVSSLKRHIKTAKVKLTVLSDDDISDVDNEDSDLNIDALCPDYSREQLDYESDSNDNAVFKKLRKQLDDVHDQLEVDGAQRERLSSKNKELQLELGSMRGLEKSVMKLEKTKKKLEEEFAIYKSQVKVTDMEQIRREMEGQYRMELNRKLDEVNRYLDEQSQARDRLDRVRSSNENALKTEKRRLEEDIAELQMKFEQALAQKETQSMETKRFRELYDSELKWRVQLNDQMQKSAEKALSYKSKLSSERQRSRMYGSWNNLTNNGMDNGVPSFDISRISMSPEKDALNSKLKAELDRSIAKHLEAAPHDNLRPVIRNNDEVLNTSSSLHKANTDYLEVLRRKYLV